MSEASREKIDVVLVDLPHEPQWHGLAVASLKDWAETDANLRPCVRIRLVRAWCQESADLIVGKILDCRPLIVGFSCYIWNMNKVAEVIPKLKQACPKASVVLGGPQVAPVPESVLEGHPGADFVVCGEGEVSFLQFLRCLVLKDRPISQVQSLAYRQGQEIHRTQDPPLMDVSLLPSPYLTGTIPLEESAPAFFQETSRGCPFTCKFCNWGPRQMRYMPLSRVEEDFRIMAGAPAIYLCDSDLLMHGSRGLEILDRFLKVTGDSPCALHYEGNPIFLSREAVDIIARSPRRFYLHCGVQTVRPEVLGSIDRCFDKDKVEKNLGYLREKAPEATVLLSLIYGLPGDTLDGFRESLDWVLSMRPRVICANHALVLPGADFHQEAKSLGLVYQQEPPHQVLQTATMDRRQMSRASELAFYSLLLCRLKPVRRLFWDAVEDLPPQTLGYVRFFEEWIESVKGCGVDLTSGMPVSEVGGHGMPEDIKSMAVEKVMQDKLMVASVLSSTSQFVKKAGHRKEGTFPSRIFWEPSLRN